MARDGEYVGGDADAGRTGTGMVTWAVIALLVIALVVLAVIAVLAWADEEGSEGPDVGVTLNDVTGDPEEYYGVDVTVSGEVNEVVAPRVFTLGGEDFLGGESLLVVSAAEIPVPPEFERAEGESVLEDDIIQVTGPVMEFVLVDVEDEAGIDLDDDTFADFEGEPVVVAQNVALNPRVQDVPAGAISIEDITDNEDVYAGQQVSLSGEVGQPIGQQAFLMRETTEDDVVVDIGEQILVIASQDVIPQPVVEDVPVEVSGTVRIFDPEDEENNEAALEEDFGFDVEDGLLNGWEDEPVLFADSVSAGAADTVLDIERIATDALAYVGNQVTTGGVVEEVVAEQAIVLTTEDEDAVVDVEVLVVGQPDVFTEPVVEDAFVQVTGTVYVWDEEFEAEVGDDFGFLFEDEETFGDFEEGIVIVAESMTVER